MSFFTFICTKGLTVQPSTASPPDAWTRPLGILFVWLYFSKCTDRRKRVVASTRHSLYSARGKDQSWYTQQPARWTRLKSRHANPERRTSGIWFPTRQPKYTTSSPSFTRSLDILREKVHSSNTIQREERLRWSHGCRMKRPRHRRRRVQEILVTRGSWG